MLKNSPEGQQTLTPDSKADYQKIRESRDENTVALAKSACDAVRTWQECHFLNSQYFIDLLLTRGRTRVACVL